jgi:L-alanine-DL-glutamate epimerase-like enolase superfamily enzyme
MAGLTIREKGVRILSAPIAERVGMSFGGLSQRTMALVEVEFECGVCGYGESWINYPPWTEHERVATIREGVAPLLVGHAKHRRLTTGRFPALPFVSQEVHRQVEY